MTKTTKKCIILLMICVMPFILGLRYSEPQEVVNVLIQTIKKQTQDITELKIKVSDLETQITQLKLEGRNDKIVLVTVNYLTKGAVPSRWADPNHINHVIEVCKKYEYLVKDVNHDYANWKFVFARCLATGLDPNFHCDNDNNGYFDNGLADLNDVVLNDLQKELPTHLKYAPWTNIDKSIAGLYIWIKQRHNARMAWAQLNKDQWSFYSKVAKLNG